MLICIPPNSIPMEHIKYLGKLNINEKLLQL